MGRKDVETDKIENRRYWIDDGPLVKPYSEFSYGIVDEEAGGIVIYVGNLMLAKFLIRLLEENERDGG